MAHTVFSLFPTLRQRSHAQPLRVGLVGLGVSTLAVADYFRGDAVLWSVRDKRRAITDASRLPKDTKMHLGDGYLESIDEDVLVLSPSVRRDTPELLRAEARGCLLTTECELFYRITKGTLFAVTGSDGKSTTASVAHALLSSSGQFSAAHLGGNIGTPLLSLLSGDDRGVAYVAELSSFQLMHAVPRAERALITNLTPNHLDLHSSLEEYYNAKICLLKAAKEPIFNADDPVLAQYASDLPFYASYSLSGKSAPRSEHRFTLKDGALLRDGNVILRAEVLAPFGKMMRQNILAAIALCDGYCPAEALPDAIGRIRPLPHRRETVDTVNGVTYVDSSADTTPSRTAATLSEIISPVVLLLGGRSKGVSLEPLLSALGGVRYAVCYGENRALLCEALSTRVPTAACETLFDAVALARSVARFGECVLLSPASTSHDQFHNYTERAAAFRDAIKNKG